MAQISKGVALARDSQGKAIQAGATHLGDVVMYDLANARIERATLRGIFAAHGFDAFVPSEIEPSTALGRAAAKPVPRGLKVLAFAKPKGDTTYAVGVYVQRARDGEQGDDYVCGARARVEASRVVAMPPEGAAAVPEALEVAQRIASGANELVTFAETTDVTSAVVGVLTGPMRGIAMRRRGGAYFIRPEFSAAWQALAKDLAAHGFFDLSYPMAGDGRSRTATAHMVRQSLEGELAELRKQLGDINEDTRDKTLERRVEDCELLVSKAELYEEILGGWLTELRSGVERVKQGFKTRTATEHEDLFAPIEGGSAD